MDNQDNKVRQIFETPAIFAGYDEDGMDSRGHMHPHPDGTYFRADGVRGVRCFAPDDPANYRHCVSPPPKWFYRITDGDGGYQHSDWLGEDIKGWWGHRDRLTVFPIITVICPACGKPAPIHGEGVSCGRICGDSTNGYETYHEACMGWDNDEDDTDDTPTNRVTLVVEISLDPVPGGLDTLDDMVTTVQDVLDQRMGFYRPDVMPWVDMDTLDDEGLPDTVDEARHFAFLLAKGNDEDEWEDLSPYSPGGGKETDQFDCPECGLITRVLTVGFFGQHCFTCDSPVKWHLDPNPALIGTVEEIWRQTS